MAKWETEIFRGEIGERVKSEYRKLLSVNKSGEEAEQLLVDHFESHMLFDNFTKAHFWMALSLCEWQFGRLTQTAKKSAQTWASLSCGDVSSAARQSLMVTLDMPMPPQKIVRLPAYVSHCPWPVGSLLAYRIISSDHPHVTQSPFHGKYVLLRVVEIKKNPITDIAPNDGWDERMLVGLYDWIGDAIPDPGIVRHLRFTAISVEAPVLQVSDFKNQKMPLLSAEAHESLQKIIHNTTHTRIETCCDLDWKCLRGINSNDVFTYLACDPSYRDNIPPLFKTDITDYSMCHSIPFDAVLVNRFYQLMKKQPDEI